MLFRRPDLAGAVDVRLTLPGIIRSECVVSKGTLSSPPALLAEVTRGPVVESRHFGHAVVVDRDGEILFSAGDPDYATFPRSSLKPLQALACLARGIAERFELTDAEVAVICASHQAEARHREAVERILKKAGAREENLRCGPHPLSYAPVRDKLIRAGRRPTPIYSNCSGKHAGMLALARLFDAPLEDYWKPGHPVQREVRRVIGVLCDLAPGSLQWGMDGCGLPNYLLPLGNMALAFARLSDPSGLEEADRRAAERVVRAMTSEPEMVSGEGKFDSVLMRALQGAVIAKGGAEGYEAVGLVGRGIGMAIKIEDGSSRAIPPVVMALLKRFDVLPQPLPPELRPLARPTVTNTCDEVVGEIRCLL